MFWNPPTTSQISISSDVAKPVASATTREFDQIAGSSGSGWSKPPKRALDFSHSAVPATAIR
ncbi:hypothetical protein D3C83_283260 [compost metagenome]